MTYDQMTDDQYNLLFDVRRSIRYHERRQGFFIKMHQITGGLTVLLAGSVLFDLAKTGDNPWWLNAIAVFSALLAAWDIVIGYSAKSVLHQNLRSRWVDLEIKMMSAGLNKDSWDAYSLDRLSIERDEPPIYRALDVLCHNELLVADGHGKPGEAKGWAEVCFFQRMTSHILRWPNIVS